MQQRVNQKEEIGGLKKRGRRRQFKEEKVGNDDREGYVETLMGGETEKEESRVDLGEIGEKEEEKTEVNVEEIERRFKEMEEQENKLKEQ